MFIFNFFGYSEYIQIINSKKSLRNVLKKFTYLFFIQTLCQKNKSIKIIISTLMQVKDQSKENIGVFIQNKRGNEKALPLFILFDYPKRENQILITTCCVLFQRIRGCLLFRLPCHRPKPLYRSSSRKLGEATCKLPSSRWVQLCRLWA